MDDHRTSLSDERFGDDFRDDRFDDPGLRDSYGAGGESLADVLAEDERPLASPWTRLGAQLIDGVIGGGAVLLVLLSGNVLYARTISAETGGLSLGLGLLVLLLLVGVAGYQFYLLTTQGQTIGKKVLKLRIVDAADGTNPGFVRTVVLRLLVNALLGAIPLYGLVDALFIFRDDRKCIHDHLAKTVVVTEEGPRF